MVSRVDPQREEVRGERQTWPFALDCRVDSAAIGLGGTVYRLQPLRWREKRNLSRYHRLGEEFVGRQFVKLCLVEDVPLPPESDEYEALLTLARWINAPGDEGSSLPLDPGLLTSVTLAVAQAVGVSSSELDLEKADFVERLWRERSTDRTAASGEVATNLVDLPRNDPSATIPRLPGPGEMNRILILPDPPLAVDSADFEDTANLSVSDQSVRLTSATIDFPVAPAPDANPSSLVAAPPQASRAPARFRVRLPAAVDGSSRPDGSRPEPVRAPALARPPTVPQLVGAVATTAIAIEPPNAPDLPINSAVSNGTSPFGAVVTHARPRPDLSRATGFSPVETGSIGLPRTVPSARQYQDDAVGAATPTAVSVNAPGDPNADDLFDRWADQLEQAAEQLGIDPEG